MIEAFRLEKEKVKKLIEKNSLKTVPLDCRTCFKQEDFQRIAGQLMSNLDTTMNQSSNKLRRKAIVSTIRDKINDLGMSSNARRYDPKVGDSDNKIFKLMRSKRGDHETYAMTPTEELRSIYAGKLESYHHFLHA